MIPPQDPPPAPRRSASTPSNPGYVCAYLPASGLKTLYGHELYDPVYDAAQETGLPVAIHSVEAVYPVFPFQLEQFRTALAVHSLAHPLAMVANLVSMLETGVPVRFPGLRIAFMEAGTGWVPWIANRLDKEYTERRREVPILQERPSHYMRRFRYGTQPIEEPERRTDVVKLFELFDGEHTAMFASDWPHHDFDHTQHVFGLPFGPEARRRIMGLNAAEFFGLDVAVSRASDRAPGGAAARHAPGRARRQPRARRLQHPRRGARDPEPLPAPARAAVRGRRLGDDRLRARTRTGSSRGSGRTRSSPAPGTRSSSTCPPGAASPSTTSGCARTRCASPTAASCGW